MSRTIESPRGNGKVKSKGKYLADVRYEMVVRQSTAGLKSASGYLWVTAGENNLFDSDDDLTLRLEDKREISIIITNWEPFKGQGDFQATGGFRPSSQ